MNANTKQTLGIIVVAALAALVLALIPMSGRAAESSNEGFCSVVADAVQVATNARNQGALLGQYRSKIAKLAGKDNADMALLFDKMGVIVYTSEDFAGLTPEQAMRYAYRTCMSADK